MNLFQDKEFFSHSNQLLEWKIEGDALTDEDIETLAKLIGKRFSFYRVEGIPTGGLKIAKALHQYINPSSEGILIVDDVLTTGTSMEEIRQQIFAENPVSNEEMIFGVVIFSRSLDHPEWIYPIFQLQNSFRDDY